MDLLRSGIFLFQGNSCDPRRHPRGRSPDRPSPAQPSAGFNLSSASSLSNFIAIINGEFGYSIKDTFSDAEYAAIFGDATTSQTKFGKFAEIISTFRIEARWADNGLVESAKEYFHARALEYQDTAESLWSYGISITKATTSRFESGIDFDLDPFLAHVTTGMVVEVLAKFSAASPAADGSDASRTLMAGVVFQENVKHIESSYNLAARLFGTELKIGAGGDWRYKDHILSFGYFDHVTDKALEKNPSIPRRSFVAIECTVDELATLDFNTLLWILFDRGTLSAG